MTTGRNSTVYQAARVANLGIGATRGIDAVLDQYGLDALLLPAEGYATSPAAIVRFQAAVVCFHDLIVA